MQYAKCNIQYMSHIVLQSSSLGMLLLLLVFVRYQRTGEIEYSARSNQVYFSSLNSSWRNVTLLCWPDKVMAWQAWCRCERTNNNLYFNSVLYTVTLCVNLLYLPGNFTICFIAQTRKKWLFIQCKSWWWAGWPEISLYCLQLHNTRKKSRRGR